MKKLMKRMILTQLALIFAGSIGFAADTTDRVIAANPVVLEQSQLLDNSDDYMPEKEALALLKAELSEDDLNIEW